MWGGCGNRNSQFGSALVLIFGWSEVVLLSIQFVAARFRFVVKVPAARCPFAGVNDQFAVLRGIEPEALDGTGSTVFGYRMPPPRKAAIGSEQKEWIARQRILDFSRGPAVFQIVKLQVLNGGAGQARSWLFPCEAGIVARNKN